MSDEKEKLINPDEWTEKELLKHLYREFNNMTNNYGELVKKIEKVEKFEGEINRIKTTAEVKEEELNKRLNKNSYIIGVIGIIITMISLLIRYGVI